MTSSSSFVPGDELLLGSQQVTLLALPIPLLRLLHRPRGQLVSVCSPTLLASIALICFFELHFQKHFAHTKRSSCHGY